MKLIYAGPSLSKLNLENILSKHKNITIKDPIEAGDIWNHMATINDITDILIIDGYFYSRLAVLHTEILEAINSGITVHGSASLGALRAVELAERGMIGHGKIYKFYSLNPQTGDDEVAVLHSPQEPYENYTVPLINIRILHDKFFNSDYGNKLSIIIGRLEKISFCKRSWQQIKQICLENIPNNQGLKVYKRIKHDYIDYKHRDAIEAVNMLAKNDDSDKANKLTTYNSDKNKLKNQYIRIRADNEDIDGCNIDQLTSLLRLTGVFSPSSFAIEHFKDIVYKKYHDSFIITDQDLEEEVMRINSKVNKVLTQDLGIRNSINVASAHWAKKNLVFNRYIKEKIDENQIHFVNHLLFRSIAMPEFTIESDIDQNYLSNLRKALKLIIVNKDQIHKNSLLKTFSMMAKIRINQFWNKALITRFNDYKKILNSILPE